MGKRDLTFDADNVVPDLLAQSWIWDGLDEVVDGVDGRVDTLKSLDLLPDGQRVVPVGLDLGERPIDAAHSRQGVFFRHECYSQMLTTTGNMLFKSPKLVCGGPDWRAAGKLASNVRATRFEMRNQLPPSSIL